MYSWLIFQGFGREELGRGDQILEKYLDRGGGLVSLQGMKGLERCLPFYERKKRDLERLLVEGKGTQGNKERREKKSSARKGGGTSKGGNGRQLKSYFLHRKKSGGGKVLSQTWERGFLSLEGFRIKNDPARAASYTGRRKDIQVIPAWRV